MIHLANLNDTVIERALNEIEIYKRNGLQGCIIENYHGSISDVEAVLSALTNEHKKDFSIGINILPNEYHIAYRLAKTYDVDFIQMDYIAGKYKGPTKEGLEVDKSLFDVFRKFYPHIQILGGVWPKYYKEIRGSVLNDDIKKAISMSDAIVVTGIGTGQNTPIEKIFKFHEGAGGHPIIVGSGVTKTTIRNVLILANGVIAGSCFKPNGNTIAKVDETLVAEFMNEISR